MKAQLSKALDPEQHGLGELSARVLMDQKVKELLSPVNMLITKIFFGADHSIEFIELSEIFMFSYFHVARSLHCHQQGGLCGLAALYWALTDTLFTPSQVALVYLLVCLFLFVLRSISFASKPLVILLFLSCNLRFQVWGFLYR